MKFVFRQTISEPVEVVFRFFNNPERLRMLHPEETGVKVLRHGNGVLPGCETCVRVAVLKILQCGNSGAGDLRWEGSQKPIR